MDADPDDVEPLCSTRKKKKQLRIHLAELLKRLKPLSVTLQAVHDIIAELHRKRGPDLALLPGELQQCKRQLHESRDHLIDISTATSIIRVHCSMLGTQDKRSFRPRTGPSRWGLSYANKARHSAFASVPCCKHC